MVFGPVPDHLSIVRNLLLQRIPVAALQLNAPFLAESSSESMQELIESWILTRCAGKPLLQLDQVTMGGSCVGAPQNLPMVIRREMLQAVKASHSEGTFNDITRLTLLQPGMREPLSHFRQVEIQIEAVHESAVVHDESDSLETVDGVRRHWGVHLGRGRGVAYPECITHIGITNRNK